MRRRQRRQLVRDAILDYREENPNATREEIQAGVERQLGEDFAGSIDLPGLLRLVQLLIQILDAFRK